MDDQLLSLRDLADYLDVPVTTIYQWRAANPPKGPRGLKVGRHVRVRESELIRWLDAQADPEPVA